MAAPSRRARMRCRRQVSSRQLDAFVGCGDDSASGKDGGGRPSMDPLLMLCYGQRAGHFASLRPVWGCRYSLTVRSGFRLPLSAEIVRDLMRISITVLVLYGRSRCRGSSGTTQAQDHGWAAGWPTADQPAPWILPRGHGTGRKSPPVLPARVRSPIRQSGRRMRVLLRMSSIDPFVVHLIRDP